MRFFINFIKSVIRMAVGVCILLVSASIPAYFMSVDRVAVVAAGSGTATPEDVARIYLDNVKYVQSGWLTEGLKMAEIALNFGANDVGGVLMDEMVVRAAGIDNRATAENMRRVIVNAGKIPRERDGLYKTIS